MKKNIEYKNKELANYLIKHRSTWDSLYKSEKYILEKAKIKDTDTILDIGCGVGLIARGLKEKYNIRAYTGIEMSKPVYESAIRLNPQDQFLYGDFLDISKTDIINKTYDLVFSLSCFDWNVKFDEMLVSGWQHVAEGGSLIATFRLVDGAGYQDMNISYQNITYEGKFTGERAPYSVFNAKELLNKLYTFSPSSITAYGYYGSPSPTSITPYNEICFSTFLIKKGPIKNDLDKKLKLDLPTKILSILDY